MLKTGDYLMAVLGATPVAFTYSDTDGVQSQRHATFTAIERCQNGVTVIRAYDLDRKAPRTFRLTRISDARPLGVRVTRSLT